MTNEQRVYLKNTLQEINKHFRYHVINALVGKRLPVKAEERKATALLNRYAKARRKMTEKLTAKVYKAQEKANSAVLFGTPAEALKALKAYKELKL